MTFLDYLWSHPELAEFEEAWVRANYPEAVPHLQPYFASRRESWPQLEREPRKGVEL